MSIFKFLSPTPLLPFSLVLVALFLVALFFIHLTTHSTQSRSRLPPSPPSHRLLSHLPLIPRLPHHFYTTLPPLSTLRLPFRPIIIVNSLPLASHLLDKHSATTAGRPPLRVMEYAGFTETVTHMQLGYRHSVHRKVIGQSITAGRLRELEEGMGRAARELAVNLSRAKADELSEPIHRFVTTIISQITFGHVIPSEGYSEHLEIVRAVSHTLANLGSPGVTFLDIIPFAKYLPAFFFDTPLKIAAKGREAVRRLHQVPYQTIRRTPRALRPPSMLTTLVNNLEDSAVAGIPPILSESETQGVAGATFAAGTDTTVAVLLSFLLACLQYPSVFHSAQKEVINTIGHRPPTFADREKLTVVTRFLNETLRWQPPTPVGVPHVAISPISISISGTEYTIPSETPIISNIYGMTRDPTLYSDPDTFNPDRYLVPGEPEPHFVFGFGRRVCVGRGLAMKSLWMAVAMVLWGCEVERICDEEGREIIPKVRMSPGLTSHVEGLVGRLRIRKGVEHVVLGTDKSS